MRGITSVQFYSIKVGGKVLFTICLCCVELEHYVVVKIEDGIRKRKCSVLEYDIFCPFPYPKFS